MAIGVVGSTVGTGNNEATVTAHASMATGDLSIIVGGATNTASDQNVTCAFSGGGGSELTDAYANGATVDVNAGAFLKEQGGSLDTFVVFDGGALQGALWIVLDGHDSATPMDVSPIFSRSPGDVADPDLNKPQSPAVTTATDNAMVISWMVCPKGTAVANPPSGYTLITSTRSTSLTGVSVAAAYKMVATAGLETPPVWGDIVLLDANDSWVAGTIVVREAGAGGGDTYTLDADAAAYSYTASNAGLEFDRLLNADAASYAWTAQSAGLEFDRQVPAASAAYAWTANDAGLEYDREIAADSAAYAWTADDASLEYTPAGTTYTLAADSAAYLWSATDADLIYTPLQHYTLDADAAAYVWGASDAGLEWSGAPIVVPGTPTYGGGGHGGLGHDDYELRVRHWWDEIDRLRAENRTREKSEERRERDIEQSRQELEALERDKSRRQARAKAERKRVLRAEIAAIEDGNIELRAAIEAAETEIERIEAEIAEFQQAQKMKLRRRRMLLALALAATQ